MWKEHFYSTNEDKIGKERTFEIVDYPLGD